MRDIRWVAVWAARGIFPVRALLSLVGASGHRQLHDFILASNVSAAF